MIKRTVCLKHLFSANLFILLKIIDKTNQTNRSQRIGALHLGGAIVPPAKMKVEILLTSILFLVIYAKETCDPEHDSDCQEGKTNKENKYAKGDST